MITRCNRRQFSIWVVLGSCLLFGLGSIQRSFHYSLANDLVFFPDHETAASEIVDTMKTRMSHAPLTSNYQNSDGGVTSSGWTSALQTLWRALVIQTHCKGTTNHMTISSVLSRQTIPKLDGSEEIVLVSHGSVMKLATFLTQLEYWQGPASFAVYISDGESQLNELEKFVDQNRHKLMNTSIHMYMEYTNHEEAEDPLPYPHNLLRNLAMDECGSDFFLALDVDFIPGPKNCHGQLQTLLNAENQSLAHLMKEERKVLILPAFEIFSEQNQTTATPDLLPSSKAQLQNMVESNRASPFHLEHYQAGHTQTNYSRWFAEGDLSQGKDASSNTTLQRRKPFYQVAYRPGFEPYVLAYRPGIPNYWPSFRGFGFNKVSWFMELHRAGYTMGTLTQEYVVHLEHPSTYNLNQRDANGKARDDFVDYLDARYPLVNNRMPKNYKYFYSFPKTKAMPSKTVGASSISTKKSLRE